MVRFAWLVAALLPGLLAGPAEAQLFFKKRKMINTVNRRLHGTVVDHTANHGRDYRLWSNSLGQRRDLYVYLPPGYDPRHSYPFLIYLHGYAQDEYYFLEYQVDAFDQAMACGDLPPMIIAAPDGSIQGRPSVFRSASFFVNSQAGAFEDFLIDDVWNFVAGNYPIRPEREAHAIAGVSGGGGAAFFHALKHHDRIKSVVGVMPAVNLRWVDGRGRYRGNFDPSSWGYREQLRPKEVIARVYGIVPVRLRTLTDPLYGRGPNAIRSIAGHNPIEVMDQVDLQPGQLDMFIGYGGRDEFNIDAQVESFLFRARQRGVHVDVAYDPNGRHDLRTGMSFFPEIAAWLKARLEKYSPRLNGG